MDFSTLYNKISPKLNAIAWHYNGRSLFIDHDDLYQQMCLYLWLHYKDGVPEGVNESYIVKGCEFHILNYMRKEKESVLVLSLEETINDEGDKLEDIIADNKEAVDIYAGRHMAIEDINKSGLNEREKRVLSFLLEGRTVRDVAKELGISHVMVVKMKKKIIEKWRNKRSYQKS